MMTSGSLSFSSAGMLSKLEVKNSSGSSSRVSLGFSGSLPPKTMRSGAPARRRRLAPAARDRAGDAGTKAAQA